MKNRIAVAVAGVLLTAGTALYGQQQPAPAQAPASTTPVAPQPKVKSAPEQQALQTFFQAQDAATRLKTGDEFTTKFPDSEFKPVILLFMMETYRQQNDFEKTVIYGERTLEADPKNFAAMIMLAQAIAGRTREFDLDREEKLGKVEKYVKDAIDLLKTAPRPRADVTDAQWEAAKKDYTAQGHETLAMAAQARKKLDVAIAEFRAALSVSANPDPATSARLARVLNEAGKYDEAIAEADKVMAMADAAPVVKQYAQAEKARATQAKGKTAAPAAPAPAPAPAPAAPPAPKQ